MRVPSRLGGILPTSAASGDTVTLSADQIAAAIAEAAAPYVVLPSSAVTPSAADLSDAIATLGNNVPQVAVATNLPIPAGSGGSYSGLSGFSTSPKYRRYVATQRQLGAAMSTGQISTLAAAGTTVSLIALDASIGALAGPIGAAVGVIVGVIAGLFAKKVQSPPTTAAQIQQAATYIAAYKQMAGTVIGRTYPIHHARHGDGVLHQRR